MPGVYKEKVCPTCLIHHRKKGAYCSISCSNGARTLTDQTKEKIADGLRDYYLTPEGLAQASINNRRVNALKIGEAPPITIEEFTVDIPTIYDIPDGYTPDF